MIDFLVSDNTPYTYLSSSIYMGLVHITINIVTVVTHIWIYLI